jgi:hypothetical protein
MMMATWRGTSPASGIACVELMRRFMEATDMGPKDG